MSKNDKNFDLSKFTFASGTELSSGELIMIGHPFGMDPGKNPESIFLIRDLNGNWHDVGEVEWLSEGVSGNAKKDSVFIFHRGGLCLEFNEKEHFFSNIYTTEENKNNPPSELRFSKVIDNKLYVGGTNQFLFQQVGLGWQEISTEAMKQKPRPISFENITGFNSEELYAFGWKGAIWTNKGKVWKEAKTPTEYMLFDGDVLNDKVIIAGQLGVVLIGRGEKWEEIKYDFSSSDFLSVCTFQNAVYFSNTKHIVRYRDGKMEVFLESTTDFKTYKLFKGPSGLWSVSDKHLAFYDGKEWNIIN